MGAVLNRDCFPFLVGGPAALGKPGCNDRTKWGTMVKNTVAVIVDCRRRPHRFRRSAAKRYPFSEM